MNKIHPNKLLISTNRISVEEITLEDSIFFQKIGEDICDDVNISEGKMPFYALSKGKNSGLFFVKKAMQEREVSPRNTFRMAIKSKGEVLGNVTIDTIPDENNMIGDLGYFLSPKYQGCGYAKEAVLVVLDCCFKQFGFDHIDVTAHPDNAKSDHLLCCLGFEKDNYIEHSSYNDEPRQSYILKKDKFYETNQVPSYVGGFEKQNIINIENKNRTDIRPCLN
ncbi:MAG: GNAT family N-acetyltransferase [Alphaproteobacteria bacterium]|jgi:RimJ/RimL family protein N-acetyltransferase|nr:GNAT family N-acetyltransferase [Alphaproteobacteria bacterium]